MNNKLLTAPPKSFVNSDSGFGIVESVTASAILAVLVLSSISLVSTMEKSKYNASLRDAVRQVIDDDISKLKTKLFDFNYVPAVSSSTPACYKSNSSCSGANSLYTSTRQHMLVCRNISANAISYLGGTSRVLVLDGTTHKIFSGRNPLSINRTLTAERPSSVLAYRTNADLSLVRVTYRVTSKAIAFSSPGLLADFASEILRVEKLYPDSHAYCNPE